MRKERGAAGKLFEECSFVAVTTTDLARCRRFWVEGLGFGVIREDERYFMIQAGGTRLCFDLPDGRLHKNHGLDPVIGLKVRALPRVVAALQAHGIKVSAGPFEAPRGNWAELRDPDGRKVILTEGG